MKTMKRFRFMPTLGWLACVALACLIQAPDARADMILLSTTTLVRGSSAADLSFDAPSAGTVTATLMNQSWGPVAPLAALSFMANSNNGVVSSWSSPVTTTESFQVGAGTYFAHIMAAATGVLDIGVYSLNLSFVPSAVPLPASGWMLLIGVFVMFGIARAVGGFRPFEGFRDGVGFGA